MNFLAHLYLSDHKEELLIGNFIADFVKGKRKDLYSDGIRRGIELHRAIDDFTDHHSITSAGKKRIYHTQHKYAPVVLDMFYDHFLAKNFYRYSSVSLPEFADYSYQILLRNQEVLPLKVREFLPFMIEKNWLVNYATVEGITRSLKGLSKRVNFPNTMDTSGNDLLEHYSIFEEEFALFFPELINFTGSMR